MLKRVVLSAFLIYLLFLIVSFFILPSVLKSQIETVVAKETNSKLSIEKIYFNPFSFKIEVSGILLKTLEDKKIVSLEMLEVDAEPHSLLFSALHIKSITLKEPEFFVVYNQDRTFNFSKIVKDENKSNEEIKEPIKLPRIIIDTVKVEDGVLNYEDFTTGKKFELSLNPIDFKVVDIDTDNLGSSDATFRFNTFLSDGGEIDLRGKIASYKPLKLDGTLNLDEIKFYTIWRYIQDKTVVEVADGEFFFSTNYYLNLGDLNTTKMDETHLSLDNLRIKPKDKNSDILNLKSLYVEGAVIKPMMQDVYASNITFESLRAKVKRDKRGDIDWIEYLKEKQKASENKKTKKEQSLSSPWNVILDSVTLKKIAVDIEDRGVVPSVNTKLNELNINLKDVTLAGEKPFLYDMKLLLNDTSVCSSNGRVKHKNLEADAYLTCKGFNVPHYRSYIDKIASSELKIYNLALKNATVGFDANVTLRDEKSQLHTFVKSANLTLKNFTLHRKDRDEKLVDLKSFDVKGARLDTKIKEVTIDKIAFDALGVYAQKDKKGMINLDGLIETKEDNIAKKSIPKGAKTKEEAYRVRLKSFDINSAKVSFNDKSIQKSSTTILDKIELHAKDIDSKESSFFKYNLALRVNNRGAVKSKGDIKHTPLEQKGNLELNKISLKEFTPYIQEAAFLKISDGFLSLNAKTAYRQKDNRTNASINGNLKVDGFFLHDSRDNSTVASFLKADLKSFNFKTAPNSLYVDEVILDSFYLDAMIDENKNMNLAKLLKQKEQKNQTVSQKSDKTQTLTDEKFTFKLLKLKVLNGNANFADYSLPIDFKTSIHDLNGAIYALSNNKGEVAYVDVDGEVDEYGSTELKGSFDTSNIKSYMDIDFKFKNLNLNSLSGYSAQFAGYKIDEGKLFLDLKYEIKNSQLLSKNSIVIKNIKLGDEIEDENITKLPLGFAIALLEDSKGVIDINVPIDGNLDKPDFKYGTLVAKALVNLIIKAVASPFKFLGAVFGIKSDELKYVEFEEGEAVILPPEREKLNNLADILSKKPKLSLSIVGGFDKERDFKAFQSKKLRQKVLEISKQEHPTTEILETIYIQAGGDINVLKNELEKRVKKEIFAVEYQKELQARCAAAQSVTEDEVKNLASIRAKVIQNYLVILKGIDVSRVFLEEPKEMDNLQNGFVNSILEIGVK